MYNFVLQIQWFFFLYTHISFKYLPLSIPLNKNSISRCRSHPGTCWQFWWHVHFAKACLHSHSCTKTNKSGVSSCHFKQNITLLSRQFLTKGDLSEQGHICLLEIFGLVVMEWQNAFASTCYFWTSLALAVLEERASDAVTQFIVKKMTVAKHSELLLWLRQMWRKNFTLMWLIAKVRKPIMSHQLELTQVRNFVQKP